MKLRTPLRLASQELELWLNRPTEISSRA